MAKFKNENGEELSLDDILNDSEYQAEFDKKIAKALEKNKTDVNAEVQKQLEAAIASREAEIRESIQKEMEDKQKEVEANAKLTTEEKYKKELDKVKQQVVDYQTRLATSERRDKIEKYITEKGYNKDIMKLVNPAALQDSEVEAKIDEINEIFTGSVSKELDIKLKENADKQLGDKSKGSKGPEFNFGFSSIRPTK